MDAYLRETFYYYQTGKITVCVIVFSILVNKLSPRTLEIQVIIRLPQLDGDNKVLKPAVKTIVQRSANFCTL